MVEQCAAHARSGAQCKRSAVQGATVCRYHGGAAPQVRRAAARRLDTQTALQWAHSELERRGLPDRDPREHLEAVLEEAARTYALRALAVELLESEGNSLTVRNSRGEETMHPYVQDKNAALALWNRAAKYAEDAGVAQKRVKIAQDQAQQLADLNRAALASAEVQSQALAALAAEMRRHDQRQLTA